MSPQFYLRAILLLTSTFVLRPAALFAGDGTVELCGDATQLRAIRYHDVVMVFASGRHPQARYEVWFDRDGGTPEIPEYKLMHFKPDASETGPTDFMTNTAFIDGPHQAHHIGIHDANGPQPHNIPVEDIGNWEKVKELLKPARGGDRKTGDK